MLNQIQTTMKTLSSTPPATRATKRLAAVGMTVAMLAGSAFIPGAAHASTILIQENF